MKYIIIIIICFGVFSILFESCKKGNAKENNNISTSIIGTWELKQTSAAMNPNINNYPPGNGNIIKFTNASYETYINGRLEKSGQYTVIEDSTVEANVCLVFPSGEFTDRIIYDSNYNETKKFMQISNNKLTFISGCYAYDAGYSEEYEKQETKRQ